MSEADTAEERDPIEGLEDRLKSHAQALESLLALTPAREYYGSQIVDGRDPSEQWNRKKQTKEEKRAARKAKLDPANQKSALDVIREREVEAKAKRKREDGEEDGKESVEDKTGDTKRRRQSDDADASEAKRREKAEKRKEKRQRKKEKMEKKKVKAEVRKARAEMQDLDALRSEKKESSRGEADGAENDDDEPQMRNDANELDELDVSGLADMEDEKDGNDDEDEARSVHSSAPTTPILDSPAFDLATNHSTASSSSSIDPPLPDDPSLEDSKQTTNPITSKPVLNTALAASAKSKDLPSGTSSPKIQLPHINDEELQARLRARIEALRAARKADGPDGKPAKSRQELLDQRRKKEEQRKANKKAQRQKAKEDEQRKREEQLRGSGSPLSRVGDIFSPQPRENNFSFSRLAFQDGSAANADMTELRDPKKKKGPSDPRTALQAAQNREAKIAGFDDEKKAGIAEKDMWLNARKRAHGERVRDDSSLLKKALKRKEKQKSKSEKDWQEREQAVVKGKEMKQKKREANLAKRREEKGAKGKKKGTKKKPSKGRRPGFEGRFKV